MKKQLAILLFVLTMVSIPIFAANETIAEKSITYELKDVNSISLEAHDRYIVVKNSEDNLIHIEYFENNIEYLDIDSSTSDLQIKLSMDKKFKDYFFYTSPSELKMIEIRIPNNSISKLSIKNKSGNILISDIAISDKLVLDINNGDIETIRIEAPFIEMKAKNGNISGTIIGSWDDYSITSKIKKGNSNLPTEKRGGNKNLIIDCNNGDIDLEINK